MKITAKGLFYLRGGIFLFFSCLLPPSINASEKDVNPGYPPPLELPCSPAPPPNVSTEIATNTKEACLNFLELYNKYLKLEGQDNASLNNRSVKFYYIVRKFIKEKNGNFNPPYSFDMSMITKYFGYPDYVKTLTDENNKIEHHAYLFDHKSKKDYAIIISLMNGNITSISYGVTERRITKEWGAY